MIDCKSAWEVLQDIANFACCHVYADRYGEVVLEQDEFNGTMPDRDPDVTLSSRSFKKVKVTLSFRDIDRDKAARSIRINGLREYDYDATLYATTNTRDVPPIIEHMAYSILSKYGDGVAFVDTEWKGNVNLGLDCKFNAKSHLAEDEVLPRAYEVLSNEYSLSDGFTQVTRGRCARLKEPLPKEEYINIDEYNSFRFSLPVKSRTVVNQVNVSYYVLEEVPATEGPETVTINRRDCEWVYEENEVDGEIVRSRTNRFRATVKFDRVYEEITKLEVTGLSIYSVSIIRVVMASANHLTIEFRENENKDFGEEFNLQIN